MSGTVAADNQWDFEKGRLVELVAMDLIGGQRTIPEAGEHLRVGGLAQRKIEFGHGSLMISAC